ncbi:MAG: hypothetical protein Q8R17_02615 [bacterium]|nr:hypothetical protein [bacterium]
MKQTKTKKKGKKKMKAKVFEANRGYFTHEQVNDLLIEYGLQKGPDLLRDALESLKKVSRRREEVPPLPPELGKHQWWMEKLIVGEAEDLLTYAARAGSLAYRYLRKKRNGK